MAVLAKPNGKLPIIKVEQLSEFINSFNKAVISKKFIESCKKAGQLFEKAK